MDISQKNNITKMMGNLDVKDTISTNNLNVKGELLVNGESLKKDYSNTIHLGNPENNGSWKIELTEENQLLFSKKVNNEWVVNQSME